MLTEIGFREIAIHNKAESREIIRNWNLRFQAEDLVISADIIARKPAALKTAPGDRDRPAAAPASDTGRHP